MDSNEEATANEPAYEGDFHVIATFATPTEAYLLRGTLQAAGLTPSVADANIMQANPWLATALGGVRVLVPAAQLAEARRTMEHLRAGDLQLEEGDEAQQPKSFAKLASPIFSPDAAALWSFVLTPAFGAVLHVFNAGVIRDARLQRIAWTSMVILIAATLTGAMMAHGIVHDEFAPFRASILVSFVTLIWYFVAGQRQSRHVLEVYGSKYAKRGMFIPALVAAVALFALGWIADWLI